jgi:hypothetical protein
LVLVAIPFAAAWQHKPGTWWRFSLLLLAVMACYVPIHFFAEFPTFLKFPRLWILLVFFGVIISMIRPSLNFKTLLIPGLLFILMESLRSKPANDQSNYFFATEKQLLITGTYVENGQLGYRYWSEQGERSLLTGTTVHQYQPLETRNNQVVYDGKMITAGKDNKKSAVLIDNHYIIYLSDKNRGIGFYTLRKIELNK